MRNRIWINLLHLNECWGSMGPSVPTLLLPLSPHSRCCGYWLCHQVKYLLTLAPNLISLKMPWLFMSLSLLPLKGKGQAWPSLMWIDLFLSLGHKAKKFYWPRCSQGQVYAPSVQQRTLKHPLLHISLGLTSHTSTAACADRAETQY